VQSLFAFKRHATNLPVLFKGAGEEVMVLALRGWIGVFCYYREITSRLIRTLTLVGGFAFQTFTTSIEEVADVLLDSVVLLFIQVVLFGDLLPIFNAPCASMRVHNQIVARYVWQNNTKMPVKLA
jgi:hypothetical protein